MNFRLFISTFFINRADKNWMVQKLGTFLEDKVHVFYEGHKNWQNFHRQFDIYILHNAKSMVKILSNFVSFLENFKVIEGQSYLAII